MSVNKKDASVVIMAAGMGSRYGGLKQLDPIGPNGESLLEFSVFDAARAGFNKAVFVIRKDFEKEFKEMTAKRIEKIIKTEYVFQDMENIPDSFSVPAERTKPWGTGHAVYCVKDAVNEPFVLINADDYYGITSFKQVYDYLMENDEMCMAGFSLGNTLTENGTVSRGVCETENGYLKSITEHTALDKNSGIPLDTVVSMNMWGLTPKVFDYIKEDFAEFLSNLSNPLKEEFYIPSVIDNMINNRGDNVKVLECPERWYGVTYKEDKPVVVAAIKKLTDGGFYDELCKK